ncbi:MAG: hypothetical protein HeimC3_37810 [Candidatus Heimdallarchaeota archaeon LC_3]|nr:MAG: hypothetical protein HeimC3_50580 [Candidatus Heimdallarchaeota archaeon LC_3]OLS21032.1 MAG: hypothetical protein HeimC3_37810 [Candidatus Heimdallarchaeota archaeon LC_3]
MPNFRKIINITLLLLMVSFIVAPIKIKANDGLKFNVKTGDTKVYTLTLLEEGKEQQFTVKVIIESFTANGVRMDYTGYDALEKDKACFEEDIFISCFFKWIEFNLSTGAQSDKDYQPLKGKFLTRTGDQSAWTDHNSNDPGYTITDLEVKFTFTAFNSNTNINITEERIYDLHTGWLKSSNENYEHKEYNEISKFSFVQEENNISSSTSSHITSSDRISTTPGWEYGILIFALVSILSMTKRKRNC